jgi:hypothetical protein
MVIPSVVVLEEFASGKYFELEEVAPGTYTQVSEIRGNSILSSVFLEASDPGATVQVNFYDSTTGAAVGERYELGAHDLVTAADVGSTFRILVGRIHRRVVCEVIVAGGNATFSVYATAVTSSASDIDSALIRDGEDYTDPEDKAIPIAYLDETTDQLFFVRGVDGAIKVTGTVSAIVGGKTTPSSRRFNCALANTEYSLVIPANTQTIVISNENTSGIIQASWQSGESSTNYFLIKPGQNYSEIGIITTGLTLYIQASKDNTALSIVEWI